MADGRSFRDTPVAFSLRLMEDNFTRGTTGGTVSIWRVVPNEVH